MPIIGFAKAPLGKGQQSAIWRCSAPPALLLSIISSDPSNRGQQRVQHILMHLTQRRRQVPSQCNTVLPSVCPGFCRGEQLVAFINPRRAPATVTRLVCGEAGGALRPCSRNRGTANNGRDEQPVDPPTTGRACATWEVAGPPPSHLQLPSLRVHRWEARAHDQRSPVPFLGHDVLERPVLPNVHRRQQERAGMRCRRRGDRSLLLQR